MLYFSGISAKYIYIVGIGTALKILRIFQNLYKRNGWEGSFFLLSMRLNDGILRTLNIVL